MYKIYLCTYINAVHEIIKPTRALNGKGKMILLRSTTPIYFALQLSIDDYTHDATKLRYWFRKRNKL